VERGRVYERHDALLRIRQRKQAEYRKV